MNQVYLRKVMFDGFNFILQRIVGTKVFCVPLQNLVGQDDKIPVFMDNLIHLIETHGLYTEGIYRKSGAAPKINLLKTTLDSGKTGNKKLTKDYFDVLFKATIPEFFL